MSSSSMAALRLGMPPRDLVRERELTERVADVLGVTVEDMQTMTAMRLGMQTSLATNKVLRRIMDRTA